LNWTWSRFAELEVDNRGFLKGTIAELCRVRFDDTTLAGDRRLP